MNDEKLHSLTENQLRALYNSAPEYLQSLLDRKRALEDGIVWELSIPERATERTPKVSGEARNSGASEISLGSRATSRS